MRGVDGRPQVGPRRARGHGPAGAGGFVWPAYGVVTLGLIGALVISWRGLKAREREFETLKRERP